MINTSVYGAANTWIDTYFYDKFYHNKKANFGDSTSRLLDGVTKGKLSYNEPIDKSIGYCGLGTECALSHFKCLDVNNGAVRVVDTIDNFVTNFAFFEISQNTGTDGAYSQSQLSDMKLYRAWQSTFDDNDVYWTKNKNRLLQPYTLIHPKSVVFCIYVRAYNNAIDDYIEQPLSTYVSSYSTTYPKISQVFIVPFFNNPNAISAEQPARTTTGGGGGATLNDYKRGFMIGLLDEYKLENKNFSMYSYFMQPDRVVMGNVTGIKVDNNRTNVVSFCYIPDGVGEHHKTEFANSRYIVSYIEYYDGFAAEVLKTVACFGLYFTDKNTVAQTGTFTDADMYIGLLDENGIGHGEYLRGTNTVNAPQNNFTDMSQSGYDYTKEVDKTKYDNTTYFNYTLSSSAFTKMYVLTDSELSALANELYTAVHQAPSGEEIERYNQSVFLTQNPIDCIISLKQFPLELPFSVSQNIKLGSYTCTTTGAPLLYPTGIYSFIFSKSLDNTVYPVNDKTFLDYEPYTKCELSIPFCGTVEIPVSYIYDYDTITVQLVIDYITGACTAYIISNGITIESIQGSCAISLPVNGLQSATLDSQIHSAATARDKSALTNGLGLIGGAASLIIGIATGGAGLAVAGGLAAVASAANMITQDKNIEYDLQHMQVPLKQIGSASGAIAQSYDMRCKMRITRPKISADYDAEVYANTIGFACLINTTVDTLSGLTVGDINLDGVAASDVEKQLIKNAFAGGVIL